MTKLEGDRIQWMVRDLLEEQRPAKRAKEEPEWQEEARWEKHGRSERRSTRRTVHGVGTADRSGETGTCLWQDAGHEGHGSEVKMVTERMGRRKWKQALFQEILL